MCSARALATRTRCAISGSKPATRRRLASLGRSRHHGRTPRRRADRSARTELPRRHAVPDPELLAEVVLRVESAAARDLGDPDVAGLQQASRFLQALLLEELAEEPPG